MNYNDFFYLDKDSPSGLRWKVNRYCGRLLVSKGDIAGTKCLIDRHKPQCWKVKLNNRQLKVHRIIWVLLYGEISESLVINHKDTNPFNNNIDNLELVTSVCNLHRQSQHVKNGKVNARNKSGMNGVFKYSQENRNYIRAVVSIPKAKSIVKSIRVRTKDEEDTAYTLLLKWRKDTILELVEAGVLFYNIDDFF